jgi:dienelactone hydrolase
MVKKNTIIFLHPFKTTIKDTKGFLKNTLKKYKNSRWFFPKASISMMKNKYSWFEYTTDFNGIKEDRINMNTLIIQRYRMINLIRRIAKKYHNGDTSKIIIGGISQGGCLALDISTFIKLKCVITFVSHRIYPTIKKKILAPWYCLIATKDDIFRKEWVNILSANYVKEVDDDHYLVNTDTDDFIIKILNMI